MLRVKKASTEEPGTWLYREKKRLGLLGVEGVEDSTLPLKSAYYAGGQTKLEGAAYFWFFTKLMLVTAVVFIPFALLYRPKTYLQE